MAREVIDGPTALSELCYAATQGSTDQAALNRLWLSITRARSDANLQLYEGPSARAACDLVWSDAVKVLRDFWSQHGQDLWVHEDDNTEISSGEPQNDHVCDDECRSDGCWSNEETGYRCVDAAVVGRAIFGDALFEYIR